MNAEKAHKRFLHDEKWKIAKDLALFIIDSAGIELFDTPRGTDEPSDSFDEDY